MSSLTIPNPLPSPTEDAKSLWKAFEGWGKDEKALIEILGHRNSKQIAEIARVYEQLYKETLIDRLYKEFSIDIRIFLKDTIILWATDPAERDAKLAKKALTKNGDRSTWNLIEIACASSPDHLLAVRKAYCSLYASSLEEDLATCSSYKDPFRELLVRLVSSYRYNGDYIDEESIKTEATVLYNAIQQNHLLQEEFIRIISTRSKAQLKATVEQYLQEYGTSFDEDIENCTSPFSAMVKTAIWCLVSPEKHFAEVIRAAIEGLGTDEETLTRAIVSRAEIDMEKIKEEYKKRYKKTVTHDVSDDTSGYYKEMLLTLIGPEEP